MNKTDLIIIGGGAAGLMAGSAAGELGLRALVLERKAKPGRKLLMCGNSRCNLTTNISAERMLQMFGDPVGPFLRPAIEAFTPSMLQRWFAVNGLKTVTKAGNKVYPHTERAMDVLNLFTDRLRDGGISLAGSSPVQALEKTKAGFRVTTANFVVESNYVLIATGGISYPKTGSVGDGLNWAEKLGHSITPCRPGLAGFEVPPEMIRGREGRIIEKVTVDILAGGILHGTTHGIFEIEKWGVGGTALTDASRIIARKNLKNYSLVINRPDGKTEEIRPLRTRPIKEAMITVGGVDLREINFQTLESKVCAGLYFAGEVLDIDGPTGGYNLQAAFSTARLAVEQIGKRCGRKGFQPLLAPPKKPAGKAGKTRRRRKLPPG
ncbi:aminoacetone oxidase family FAD-binding enzyme [Pontiella agarivorans]|uniref:Aminoacetone oxidase family FAD-binding enzyme n=1 Tax=Pontiella agarivorans TaxID=3038953 RepID=A0ABU5N0C5_9BACT|nr:aminoacetone oxidase family FAD-binding enzyme [Pontiella agarivorans]MDZ8119681.1 aminoacetone oxidase family FAD-binding enzyme [Pontiella agarivorans]